MDIVVRMQHYEQDQWDLRRQLTNLQTYVDDLKHEIRRIKSSDNSDDVRANLTYLLMESVKPIDSLKPEEEEPGEDHVRHREDFPNIKFFTARDWTEYKRDNKKSTRIGEPVIRGKAKSSLGENHTALYLERTDGQPADGDYVNDARKFARTLINLALTSKYKMPRKWSEADIWFQELFYTALRKRFPLFQLCHNNAKGNFFMTQAYYEAVTRKWENIRPQNLDLENAKYTIKSHSASGEDDDETVDVRDTTKASKPTTKRPPTTVITPPRPAKAARTQGQDAEPELSRQTPGKGKGCAGPSLLAIMATSASNRARQVPRRPPPWKSRLSKRPLWIWRALVPHYTTSTTPNIVQDPTLASIEAVPATPPVAEKSTTKKPRAPRKSPQWPPPANLHGDKWVYARQWYANTGGTEAEFEVRYKAMTPTERKKAARDSAL